MQNSHIPFLQHRSIPSTGFLLKSIMAIGIIIALFALATVMLTEQYFAPAPAIGTIFSPDYSESRFEEIQVGMSEKEVIALLGEPLDKDRMIISMEQGARHTTMPAGSVTMWAYSQDNVEGWDFAWLGRFVYFDSEGEVTDTLKWIFYD